MGTREGALKAWKTIRKKQQKRSEAAIKANETRGKKGRSEASKKAWKTRRMNSV